MNEKGVGRLFLKRPVVYISTVDQGMASTLKVSSLPSSLEQHWEYLEQRQLAVAASRQLAEAEAELSCCMERYSSGSWL